jgi:peptide/nickel transport system substrate-binding protein
MRKRTRQTEHAGASLEQGIDTNMLRRLPHMRRVWRFSAGWLALVLLLIGSTAAELHALPGYYTRLQSVPGGHYDEGVVGDFSDANPLYASGPADSAVSHLIFASLFTYNQQNQLTGDLATGYEANKSGTRYTVHLRPHLTWQDGRPLTASDVVFTYHVIQNPAAGSPLYVNWQHVKVSAPDARTVVFQLPNPLASFPNSLTNGIVPKHILKNVDPANLRSIDFDTTKPIGAGPFKLKTVEVHGDTQTTRETELELTPFAGYHGGVPKLHRFVLDVFATKHQMLKHFKDKSIDAMAGLDKLPKKLADDKSVRTYNMPLTAATMVFFRTTSGVLQDKTVRQALVGDARPANVRSRIGYPVLPVDEPLLHSQLGYNAKYRQLHFSQAHAAKLLKKDGWKFRGHDTSHIRYKKGKQLSFGLYAKNLPEYTAAARTLQQRWRALGANVHIYLQNGKDLQQTISGHTYGALLTSIALGVDPDEFVYWDSSQADIRSPLRLNYSEYKSQKADQALEAGRTRLKPKLRAVKYKKFLKQWRDDAPALALYQPRFLYVTHGPVHGLSEHSINSATGRYWNVQNWEIRMERKQ